MVIGVATRLVMRCLCVSTLCAALVLVLSTRLASAVHYVVAEDCDWRTIQQSSSTEIALKCRFQAIRAGPDGTNFSLIQPDHTTSLTVLCGSLFTESRLGNGTFATLRFLRSLHVEQCKLAEVPDSAFVGLVELKNLTVRTYNGDWGALSLNLARMALTPLKLLERLDIGHNNMKSLPQSPFCDLKNLKFLNLTHNSFEDMTNMGFNEFGGERSKCLDELLELDLSWNKLRYIDDRAFMALGNLRSLYLQHNQLTQLVETAFGGLIHLQVVDMSNNQLNTIPPKLFHGSVDIRELYLQNNSLGLLSPHTFTDLQQLVILNLSHNQISSEWITHDTFADLIRLVILNLSHNKLRHINATTFQSQYSLQILHLDHNQIETIDDNAFASLYNLHTLSLSDNKMKHLDIFTLNGLYVLSNLALDRNHLHTIHLEGFKNCSSLLDLQLSGNRLTDVPHALQFLRFLRSLDLSENLLQNVTNITLSGMSNLHSLKISGNRIGNMTRGTFQELKSLRRLDLSHNKIESLEHGIFDDASALNIILLNDNLLKDVNGLFMNLAHLRLLNVSRNGITWFDYALVPRQLKHLDIHDNEIETLGNYYELEDKMHLKILDASHNRIREINAASFPNQIEVIQLNHNRISIIHPFTFMAKHNLTKVNLTHNRIENVDINAFRLKPISAKAVLPDFWIADNIYFCDCTMEWLQRINSLDDTRQYPRVVDLDQVVCQMPFARRKPRMLLSHANSSDFLCKYKSHCFALCHCCEFDACDCEMVCPENCTCYSDQTWNTNIVDCSFTSYNSIPPRVPMDVTELYLDGNDMSHLSSHSFIGRKNLKVLYLNNSNVQTIHNRTFNGLVGLQVLHLDHNKVTALHGFEFENLTNLRELHLSNNRIATVSNRTFTALKSLEVLYLDNNYIVEFQVWNFNYNPALSTLRLGHNPWSCNCRFMENFQDWVHMFGGPLKDTISVRCRQNDTNGPFLLEFNATACTNFTAVTYLQAVFSDTYVPLMIVAPSLFVLLLFILVLVLIYRKQMKVWMHSKYGVRLFRRSQYAADNDRLFDAFVSYCKKDEAFVAQILAPDLECGNNPPFRLCLRYRDLPMSGYVAEAITEAIECSHRTLIVLSEQFLKSEWCRFELKSAHHELQCNSKHKLIVVLLDNLSVKEMDADARQCLRSAIVIRWGDKRFWEKLRYALPDACRTNRKQVVVNHASEVTVCPSNMMTATRCPNNVVKLV
ncbi:toll-like receptor Tollo [Ornithodoros turicata]|uniref:toll-like receptor Tollo n=1 Tax=Ornithodoros turicata TaxID=34597 RepID=UPI00313891EA